MKLTDYAPSAARKILVDLFNYDAETGELYWKSTNTVAGCRKSRGYIFVKYQGVEYRVHILIWLIQTGEWPKHKLDHKDRNGFNNRITNLREAPGSLNHLNVGPRTDNTSGHVGVTWKPKINRWVAQMQYKNKPVYLGCFVDKNMAIKAVQDKRAELITKELSHETI